MRLVEREAILCLPKFSESENSQGEVTKTDIMTIDEVASYLKLKLKTAYHLAAKGDIPGFKVGASWRFRRSEIERWIREQEQK